jgi:hypothetical protein
MVSSFHESSICASVRRLGGFGVFFNQTARTGEPFYTGGTVFPSGGEWVPRRWVPVPEASTLRGALALMAPLVWRERRPTSPPGKSSPRCAAGTVGSCPKNRRSKKCDPFRDCIRTEISVFWFF